MKCGPIWTQKALFCRLFGVSTLEMGPQKLHISLFRTSRASALEWSSEAPEEPFWELPVPLLAGLPETQKWTFVSPRSTILGNFSESSLGRVPGNRNTHFIEPKKAFFRYFVMWKPQNLTCGLPWTQKVPAISVRQKNQCGFFYFTTSTKLTRGNWCSKYFRYITKSVFSKI